MSKSMLKHVCMCVLVVLAVLGAVSFRGCAKADCTELSYLPGRCG